MQPGVTAVLSYLQSTLENAQVYIPIQGCAMVYQRRTEEIKLTVYILIYHIKMAGFLFIWLDKQLFYLTF